VAPRWRTAEQIRASAAAKRIGADPQTQAAGVAISIIPTAAAAALGPDTTALAGLRKAAISRPIAREVLSIEVLHADRQDITVLTFY
jgi:hypothetical protein